MRTQLFAFAALLVSGSLADNWVKIETNQIAARQALQARQEDESFKPKSSPGVGQDCVDTFGDGYKKCADSKFCFNPKKGEECCEEGCKEYLPCCAARCHIC